MAQQRCSFEAFFAELTTKMFFFFFRYSKSMNLLELNHSIHTTELNRDLLHGASTSRHDGTASDDRHRRLTIPEKEERTEFQISIRHTKTERRGLRKLRRQNQKFRGQRNYHLWYNILETELTGRDREFMSLESLAEDGTCRATTCGYKKNHVKTVDWTMSEVHGEMRSL